MVSSNFYKLFPLPAVKRTQLMAIILIILFSATIIHIQSNQQTNSKAFPDETSAPIVDRNLSYGERDICTYNCTSSYYNITEGHYSQTEYSFNLSWNINREVEASTENNIILVQDNKTLISIEYGKFNCYDTIVSGSKNYTDILNFHNCGKWYNLSIILSDHMKNHAIIMHGDGHNSIPYIIALKNPYTNGNISFMFGGKYSNQTIGRILVKNYTQLISPDGAVIANIGLESSTLIPYPVYNSSMAFMDSNLNSVIYLDSNMSIIRYNYYNGNYSVISSINDPYGYAINSFQYRDSFIFYYSTPDNTHIFDVNSTDLSVNRTVIQNDDYNHLLLYRNQYIMFNLNGTFIFPENYTIKIPGVTILSVNASKNIEITAFSGNTIYNYTMNNTKIPVMSGSYTWNMSGKVVYSNSGNGIDYLLEYGSLEVKPYGETYYNLSNPIHDVYENHGEIYEMLHGKLLNTGINTNNSEIADSGNSIISFNGLHMAIYSYNDVFSPYTIVINNVTENINYRNTTLIFNVVSVLNYNLSLTVFNKTYFVHNNEISFTSSNIISGVYNYSAVAINTAGYNYRGTYSMEYNNTLYIAPVTTVSSAVIHEKDGIYYLNIKGNNTGNATVAWYVNGRYSGSGTELHEKLPVGIDKLSAKISYDGKTYTVEKSVIVLGNIPYIVGSMGTGAIITIFAIETFYFNNTDIDNIIENSYGKSVKEVIKAARKNRASGRRIKYRLKALSMEGKISIARDLDNKKYVMANMRKNK